MSGCQLTLAPATLNAAPVMTAPMATIRQLDVRQLNLDDTTPTSSGGSCDDRAAQAEVQGVKRGVEAATRSSAASASDAAKEAPARGDEQELGEHS